MSKIIFLILIIVISGASIFAYPAYLSTYSNSEIGITSPLPDFLTNKFTKVLGSTSYWNPNKNSPVPVTNKMPNITAQAALTYDLTENRALYVRNPEMKLPIASITKIMTAALALENYELDKTFTVTKSASSIGENSMGLSEGEILTLEDLLYGLMLPSGNDAAETIAHGSDFGRENFIYLMNRKAEELGLTNTRFTNPSGLEGDGSQYSTPYDLLVMTRYALENPDFARIVSTYEHDIPSSSTHKNYHLYNETNLLTTYPGVKGVKTGYTFEAGLCLVTYLEYEGHRIIGVLLNAQNGREEMKELLDYSLRALGKTPPPHN